MPSAMPFHVGFADTSPVTCVIANTKTRSKKSSSGADPLLALRAMRRDIAKR